MKNIIKFISTVALVLLFSGVVQANSIIMKGSYVFDQGNDKIIVTVEKSSKVDCEKIIIVDKTELKYYDLDRMKTWSIASEQSSNLIGRTWEYTDTDTNLTATISLTFDKDAGLEDGGNAFIMFTEEFIISENSSQFNDSVD